MTVRCKMRCDNKTEVAGNTSMTLNAVYSDDPNSENRKFWEATPCGSLQMNCINPTASAQFEIGKEYYIDITLAE